MLSFPPRYHLAYGGFHSSSSLNGSNHDTRSRPPRPQNASKPSVEMSGVAFAWAAKSWGGGYRRSSRSIVSIVCVTVSMRRSLRVLASHDGRPATHVQRRADG